MQTVFTWTIQSEFECAMMSLSSQKKADSDRFNWNNRNNLLLQLILKSQPNTESWNVMVYILL